MTTEGAWPVQFPDLFRPMYVDYADTDVTFSVDPSPQDELISRIHCVAVDPQDRVIVCRSVQEWRFLPGGTREPGESISETVTRELLEEAGAKTTGEPMIFASHISRSRRPEPYRPHQPHPLSHWAFAVVRAEVIQPPTNPADGEEVIEVRSMAAPAAADWLTVHDPVTADIVRLADAMGLIHGA
ncbi:NUDIX hydrolase [Microlunatus soli]|uniref:ADP-ribose pyrophosphatase YjhB, NUDIX family n=1 Tax=Microlunatus soli TaxID=630515 RepID=A0A1H1UDH0_9ACTN|nr:NUDIX hydrolase [Microlunatus soli]SDS70480.1 ADP-ribose pyrophosphatase YjhB, NUDIX family [Microlunatus soli]